MPKVLGVHIVTPFPLMLASNNSGFLNDSKHTLLPGGGGASFFKIVGASFRWDPTPTPPIVGRLPFGPSSRLSACYTSAPILPCSHVAAYDS